MYTLSPADELADIRAEIARLKAREAVLRAQLDDQLTVPMARPGWPIRREITQLHHA